MRDVFRKTVKDDRISVAEGYFDSIDVEDSWADLVVIAQVSMFNASGSDTVLKSLPNCCRCRPSIGARITALQPRSLHASLNLTGS